MWKPSLIFLALFACSDVPAKDDPRMTNEWGSGSGGAHDAGVDGGGSATHSCTGTPLSCESQTQSQCSGSCTLITTCISQSHDLCVTSTDAASCNADDNCFFNVDHCEANDDSSCGLNNDDVTCNADPEYPCVWGQECVGDSGPDCGQLPTATACSAVPGCTWD